MKTSILLLALPVFFFSACSSTNKTSINNKEEQEFNAQRFLDAGYSRAIVSKSHGKTGCENLFLIEADGSYLQPIDLAKEFEKDGLKIWLIHRPIRPAQGECDARWVSIEAIDKR